VLIEILGLKRDLSLDLAKLDCPVEVIYPFYPLVK
jgi:hypothetical protein